MRRQRTARLAGGTARDLGQGAGAGQPARPAVRRQSPRTKAFHPDPLRDSLNVDYAQGGSAVYAPIGIPLAAPTAGDTIVYAVCPAQFVKIAKAVIDTMGHYARPDLFSLAFHARAYQQPAGSPVSSLQAVESMPAGELLRVADLHEVTPAQIEAAVSR